MATEIIRFINPSLHPDMLKSALHIALQIDENCFKNLSNEEKSKLMLQLSFFFTSPYGYYPPLSSENFELVMSLLVNLTATEDPLFLNSLLKSSDIIKKCMDLILEKGKKKTSTFAIQLFCNISRQFSQELVGKLVLYDSEFCSKLIDYFLIPDCVNKDINNSTTYLGFLVVNLSTVKSFGSLIALNKIESISSLLSSLDGSNSHRLSALRIVYNLSLQDELHVYIFNNNVVFSNNLLVALLSPLVDSEDNLTTEEIEKIPETLQYWEKRRYWDLKLWELTFCILYQFCATRLGRSFLRNANIYPLLREMDNARILKQGEENIKNGIIIEENGKKLDVLRALISILIRKEEEMGIEEKDLDKFESIRQMGI